MKHLCTLQGVYKTHFVAVGICCTPVARRLFSRLCATRYDIRHLSVAQIVRLRVGNLDFAPSAGPGGHSAHATFLEKLDRCLYAAVAEQAALPASDEAETAGSGAALGKPP